MNSILFPFTGGTDWLDEVFSSFEAASADSRSCYGKNFPPMDAYVNKEDGTMVMEFALAGYEPEKITAEFVGDRLTVTGKKDSSAGDAEKEKETLRKGIRSGSFKASYLLPEGKFKPQEAKASFKNGLLVLVIPPVQDWTPKKLVIET